MPSILQAPNSPFEPPSLLHQIIFYPIRTFVQYLYALLLFLRGPAFHAPPPSLRIRLVCISDTHTYKVDSIPIGDVLIHAGDLTNLGTIAEVQEHVDWLSSLPHPHKIAIAGNHDSFFDPRSRHEEDAGKSIRWGDVHYLQHSTVRLQFPSQGGRQLNFYGAPQIPECGGREFAFQYQRNDDAWTGTIPRETDVLVTHSPPRHHLDLPGGLGCKFLLRETWKVRPQVHIFGHVHAGYGREYVFWDRCQEAFERLCTHDDLKLLRNLISPHLWVNIAMLLWHGLLGILWGRVWGGDARGGVMINASLTYRSTGKIGNSPQLLDI